MPTYGADFHTLTKITRVFRDIDEQMPLQMAQVFLAVALQPGITSAQLADTVGISQSSVSRNTAALGEWHRLDKPGFDLIEAVDDPRERRRRIHFLTPKGRQVAVKLLEALTGQPVTDLTAPTYKEWVRGVR